MTMITHLPSNESEGALIAEALRWALRLDEAEATALAAEVTRLEHLHAGTTLPMPSESGGLVVVVCGQLEWRAAHDAHATFGPGAVLPLGTLEGGRYHAVRSVLLAHVTLDALERAGIGSARVLAAVLAPGATQRQTARGLIIGLSGSDPALTLEVAHALGAALERHGSVSVSTELDAGRARSRLTLERALPPAKFRLAVFSHRAGAAAPPVDRWLHVVHGQAHGEGPAIREAVLEGVPATRDTFKPGTPGLAPRTLLLVHEPSTRLPRGTPRHLAHHAPDTHRHLRRGHAGDIARIARELAGVSIGFTFGAGAARGLAHLGVLRAAHELSVPVDHVSAASMGAVMGALVGLGLAPDAQRELVERFVRARPLMELAFPTTALLGGDRMTKLAEEVFGSADLTDLWIPLSTMTCDLGDFTEREHHDGALGPTLLAACVLPGVLPPRVIDGRVLVDGGTTNMLPVRLLRAQSPGPVVAVDVAPWERVEAVAGEYPAGVAALLARWKGQTPPLNAWKVFWRAVSFAGAQRAREEALHADLIVSPPVGAHTFADFGALNVIESTGYKAAVEVFETPRARALLRVAPSPSGRG